MPEAFALPGAAYLQQLDDLAYPVDWTARLVIVPGSKAEPKVRKRARHLKAQAAEYEGDPAGPPAAVARNQADNEEYHERLTANRREVEIRAMVTLAVWGDSPDDAMDRAAALASDFGSTDYTFSRPAGEQASLWQAMLPGCRTPASWPATRRSSSRGTSRWPCPGADPSSATSAAASTASRSPPAAPAPS